MQPESEAPGERRGKWELDSGLSPLVLSCLQTSACYHLTGCARACLQGRRNVEDMALAVLEGGRGQQ